METTVGLVPPLVKNIFDVKGLTATSWLGELTHDDVDTLQLEWRTTGVKNIEREIRDGNKGMYDYFGTYHDMPSEFEFSMAERKCIQAIANAVKKEGIQYYIGFNDSQIETSEQSEKSIDTSAENAVLASRIWKHFSKYDYFFPYKILPRQLTSISMSIFSKLSSYIILYTVSGKTQTNSTFL